MILFFRKASLLYNTSKIVFHDLFSRSMTWEYKGLRGVHGVSEGSKGLQWVTGGDKACQGVTRGLHGVTLGDKGLQGVTTGYKG